MTEVPNQTPIEPSEEAILAATMEFFGECGYGLRAEIEAALVIAYAIDLAPIIAERDRMRAALEIIETASRAYERGEIPMVEHFLKALIIARAALEPKP